MFLQQQAGVNNIQCKPVSIFALFEKSVWYTSGATRPADAVDAVRCHILTDCKPQHVVCDIWCSFSLRSCPESIKPRNVFLPEWTQFLFSWASATIISSGRSHARSIRTTILINEFSLISVTGYHEVLLRKLNVLCMRRDALLGHSSLRERVSKFENRYPDSLIIHS